MNIGIRPSANFIKQKTGCKSGDTCLFPHYKVYEQPIKKNEKELKRRESEDKNAVATGASMHVVSKNVIGRNVGEKY